MSNAAILCTACGAPSATPLAQCAKCGGRNARVCGGCGFQNSVPKNYCDKCGTPISTLGPITAPPLAQGGPKSDIPQTVVKHVKPPKKEESPVVALPPAKKGASEPGAPQGAQPIQPAGQQIPDPFAAMPGADVWTPIAPAQSQETRPSRIPRWVGVLRRILTAGFGTFAVIASLIGVWHWTEKNKPENASRAAAVRYLTALQAGDFAAAYSQFSEPARKNCTLDEFVASRDTHTWTWSGLHIEHTEPGAMLFAYELEITGMPPRTDRVLFVEENKKWLRPYSWTLMRKVEEAFDKNNAELGLMLAQAAATVNPRDPMARGYLCEAAYYRKLPADAERQCVSALELALTYPSNLTLKSQYHLHAILADTYKNALQKPDLALEQFSQMMAFPSISPADQCEILLARSEAHQALSRPGEALADTDLAGKLCTRPQDLAYIQQIRLKLNAPAQ